MADLALPTLTPGGQIRSVHRSWDRACQVGAVQATTWSCTTLLSAAACYGRRYLPIDYKTAVFVITFFGSGAALLGPTPCVRRHYRVHREETGALTTLSGREVQPLEIANVTESLRSDTLRLTLYELFDRASQIALVTLFGATLLSHVLVTEYPQRWIGLPSPDVSFWFFARSSSLIGLLAFVSFSKALDDDLDAACLQWYHDEFADYIVASHSVEEGIPKDIWNVLGMANRTCLTLWQANAGRVKQVVTGCKKLQSLTIVDSPHLDDAGLAPIQDHGTLESLAFKGKLGLKGPFLQNLPPTLKRLSGVPDLPDMDTSVVLDPQLLQVTLRCDVVSWVTDWFTSNAESVDKLVKLDQEKMRDALEKWIATWGTMTRITKTWLIGHWVLRTFFPDMKLPSLHKKPASKEASSEQS